MPCLPQLEFNNLIFWQICHFGKFAKFALADLCCGDCACLDLQGSIESRVGVLRRSLINARGVLGQRLNALQLLWQLIRASEEKKAKIIQKRGGYIVWLEFTDDDLESFNIAAHHVDIVFGIVTLEPDLHMEIRSQLRLNPLLLRFFADSFDIFNHA